MITKPEAMTMILQRIKIYCCYCYQYSKCYVTATIIIAITDKNNNYYYLGLQIIVTII